MATLDKFMHRSMLFITWGWLMAYSSFAGYLQRTYAIGYWNHKILSYLGYILALAVSAFTVYYLIKRWNIIKSRNEVSLIYVWFSLIVSMVLINLIQFNVLESINFELQQPLFMVLKGLAIIITGGILRIRILIIGGIIFTGLGWLASYYLLGDQLALEAIGWAIAFIFPGHWLYYNHRSTD